MADLVVYVYVVELRSGEWCDVCLLPSAITVVTGLATKPLPEGQVPGASMTKTWCADCGRDLP